VNVAAEGFQEGDLREINFLSRNFLPQSQQKHTRAETANFEFMEKRND
jgi:hypothetical protein